MTDSPKDLLDIGSPLAEAAARLDTALANLEAGMKGLTERVADPAPDAAAPSAREADMEAALKEASVTLGDMIAEVRAAIEAAEAEAQSAADGAQAQVGDGQG